MEGFQLQCSTWTELGAQKAQWPNQAALNQNGPTIDLSIVVSEVLVLSLILHLHSDSQ
jgi:hypothetical protein